MRLEQLPTLKQEPRDVVQGYFDRGLRLVIWPDVGDWKGPREKDWIDKRYTIDDYHDGDRVGIMHGVELSPGKYVVDVDIDYGPGVDIALAMLPPTQFIWGRPSKKVSHCLYTCPDVIPMFQYKDVGKNGQTLIEFRADRHQSMAPPSIWEKEGKREPLLFIHNSDIAFIASAAELKQRVCLSAIGMLLAIHFGRNGFGHESRLAWAGFLLRAGIGLEDLVKMGEAISTFCQNIEIADVRRTLESTAASLAKDGRKVKGGPALAKLLGEHGKAVVTRINEWIGRDSDFIRANGIIIKDNQHNIKRALEALDKRLSYNEFSAKRLLNDAPLEDRQMDEAWLQIDSEFHFRPTYQFFEKVVHMIAWENPFHPVKDYLATLTWDKTPRLDSWLIHCAGVDDTPYTRAISSLVLIAAVRRIRHPGAKFDELLVLEGSQGVNKSSALRALCPKQEWFSDDLPLNTTSQKIIESTLGKWIIEAADLAGRRKAELEHLKASLSRQSDGPTRMAYAHEPVERARQFVIIGTTNSATYLADSTGARRFWPVVIKKFNVNHILKVRDQLWAEASVREAAGESIRLSEGLWTEAARHQEKRREVDPWEAPVRALLLALSPGGDDKRRLATEDVWEGLNIPVERRDRYGAIRIAEIMQHLGFKRTTVRKEGAIQSGYVSDNESALHVSEDGRQPGEDDEADSEGPLPF